MSGRQVLLTPHAFDPHAFGLFDPAVKVLNVNRTRKQIEDSPSIETHRPVSRQYETEYYAYYGWPNYWDAGLWNISDAPVIAPPYVPVTTPHHGHNQQDDIHLRSMKSVTGYAIQATDGQIGEVTSFMVNGSSWAIRELVVETGHWYSGKTIFLLPEDVSRISYEDSTVFVNLTKATIEQTRKNDIAHTGVSHR